MYQNNSKWSLNEKSVIINGTKMMKISAGRYIFLDSLNYLSCSLSKLPKMFNIEFEKGWFPHLFHTRENINYNGPYPDQKFYSPDTMLKDERTEFLKWYENNITLNKIFCLKYELIKYCKIDVDILRIACMRFRNILMAKTKVDPFDGPITITSTCMKVFRTMYLKPDTIALIPWNGYRRVDNQSIKAKKWLSWMSHVNKINIQTAENGREYRLSTNIKVDGYCESTNTVYEFLRCYWHACTNCFKIQSTCGEDRVRFGMRRDADKLRFERIMNAGYNLVKIRECDVDKELENECEMKAYIETLSHIKQNKLEIRDCYYGGRTNATKSHITMYARYILSY